MAYTPTVWTNREVESPRTFELQNNPNGTTTLIPKEGNVIESGTPIIADNMNNIERGIVDAHDIAQQAFQSASEGKQAIATAVTGKGVSASGSDSFSTLAGKIGQIETDKTGDATAIAEDLLTGKTAYARGQKLIGTLPNQENYSPSITTQNGQAIIPAGYHNGAGKVTASFANLVAANVRSGVNIGGVVGNVIPAPAPTNGGIVILGSHGYASANNVTEYVMCRELSVNFAGNVTVQADVFLQGHNPDGQQGAGYITKNGAQLGGYFTIYSLQTAMHKVGMTVAPGDRIQVWLRDASGSVSSVVGGLFILAATSPYGTIIK